MAHQALSLTPAAIERVRYLVSTLGDGAAGIRVGVKTAGCSGLTYTIDFAREIGPGEEVIEADGVTVVIDPKATMYLLGTEMDFRLQVQQSERGRALRLRRVVHGIAAQAAARGRDAPDHLHHGRG